jgi:putative Tad-like protein involved in Flp pilus assembly
MRPTRRNRGAIVVLAGFTLLAAIGLAVVAIDLGHLSAVAGEVQTLADSAAAGGARSLMQPDGQGDPVAAAQTLLATNTVDGKAGSKRTASDIQVGTYDYTNAQFTKGGSAPNAVRVTVSASVYNIVAGVYGDDQSTVTREAIAAFSGNSSARPTLPLAISKCSFTSYQSSGNCNSMPTLKQAPDGKDGSGWTSLGPDNASASKAVQYLPADCGGGGVTPPRLRVGDPIGIMNGQANSVLQTVQDCVTKGHNDFTIPVVDVECNGKFNKQKPVLGFATVHVVNVTAKGGAKGIDVTPICDTSSGEMEGGPDFGTRDSSIVR